MAAGARLINDVTAGLAEVAAATGAAFVAMHMQGEPRTMQAEPAYGDVVAEVRDALVERATAARDAGVGEVWIDPGIGFGKTPAHNLDLLANLDVLVATGFPVLVGTSRKAHPRPARRPGRRHRCRPAPRRPPRRLGGDGRVGLPSGRGHGPGTRGGGHRVGGPGGLRGRRSRRGSGRGRNRSRTSRGTVVAPMKGKWAQGITPRNFVWVLKDKLAICERPGGYGANHRRVRRQEEIIWIREQGFTRVISLIAGEHNLKNYDELGVSWLHRPQKPTDDPVIFQHKLYLELQALLARGEKLVMHQEEVGDRVCGLVAGYLLWGRLVPYGPQAISVTERLTGRQLGPHGRELVAIAQQLRDQPA